MNKNLKKAIKVVKNGGIAIFPTDTAFGIGCRIDDEHAVARLFKLRKRPEQKAVPVLVSSIGMAEEYVESIEPDVRRLMKKYWPGALTIVVTCKKNKIPGIVRAGGETIGLRLPKHATVIHMIRQLGIPIVGSSANFAGEKTPYKASEVDKKIINLVDIFMPGRCTIKKSSTVVDVTQKPWKILRAGAIKLKQ